VDVVEVIEVPRVWVAEAEAIHAKILAEHLAAAAATPVEVVEVPRRAKKGKADIPG
jgi:hypothetical protein